MVGTIKRSLGKNDYRNRKKWDLEVPFVVYGYRRRQMADGFSPFELMYGVPPRMQENNAARPLLNCTTDIHREMGLIATASARASRLLRQNQDRKPSGKERRYAVGDTVLLAKGKSRTAPTRVFSTKYQGPFRVTEISHPRYHLVSQGGQHSRKPIYARRLIPYVVRPSHLQQKQI